MLTNEKVTIPSEHADGKGDVESSLFELFLGNAQTISDGLQSNWDKETCRAVSLPGWATPSAV